MADRVRFELTEGVNPRRFSRPLHSTALPSVRLKTESIIYEFSRPLHSTALPSVRLKTESIIYEFFL